VDDVVAHFGRGRGRQGGHGWTSRPAVAPATLIGSRAQAPVIGAEVMAPVRHAVRLVHDEPRHRQALEQADERGRRKPLRRDVEQLQRAGARGLQRRTARLGRGQRVQRRGPDAAPRQLVDLIFHQRDERGHHDRDPPKQYRWELKAERLARPGWHDGEDVAAVEHGAHHVLLTRAERRMSEMPPQRHSHIDHPKT